MLNSKQKFLRHTVRFFVIGITLVFRTACSETDESSKNEPADSDPLEDAGADGSDSEGGEDYDVFNPDRVLKISLNLPEKKWEDLIANAVDETYTEADVNIEGEDIGKVGLRFKGSYGAL